ncbi:hypothetical protein A3860_05105 [Niastella vici]|uniref:TauD/TfdA-like domain-containing protein n=1 Tax=Niastella vici TaxID=1703345 RepID=A0A1V9FRT2_9BACT|nr:TauD/TfdA family dioxygenase [Niastella vici]OQP61099.1 hypothetical protein A3860_05105 [Niastella vici]
MSNEIQIQGITQGDMSLTLITPGKGAPAGLDSLLTYMDDKRDLLKELLHIQGGLLLRGFDIQRNEDFQSVRDRFAGLSNFSYRDGNSPRTKLSAGIYTSTEYPKEYRITLHNELSYSSKWPAYILFYCHIPAVEGGETTLADGRKLLQRLDASLVNKFREFGVRYTRFMNGNAAIGKSWVSTFETSDRDSIENYCRENDIEFRWEKDALYLAQMGPGVVRHPLTGEEVWFNQANQFHPSSLPEEEYKGLQLLFSQKKCRYPHYAYYGNGEEISEEDLKKITEIQESQAFKLKWHKGDIAILDNVLTAHGRMPFKGERKIYVSMC